MRKLLYIFLFLIFFGGIGRGLVQAEGTESGVLYSPPKTEYYKARVTELLTNKNNDDPNDPTYSRTIQEVRLVFLDGPEKDQVKDVPYYPKSVDQSQSLKVGEVVFVTKVTDAEMTYYAVSERYRLTALWWIVILFIALVLVVGRYKGLGSLIGLGFSFLVIIKFIVPRILSGHDPLITCLIGAVAITFISIYIAHGFRLRTTLAVISTIITVVITLGFDYIVIHWLDLFGSATEEAVYAQYLQVGTLNLRGLLLGGIIIGVLGVLDDITTAQAAVVDELRSANPLFTFKELYQRGMSVGKEHIASLINTLVLAYVGASFPLVLLFQQYDQPFGFIINSELIAEEIARTLIGSTALIIAVPLTTALTAYILIKYKIISNSDASHFHGH